MRWRSWLATRMWPVLAALLAVAAWPRAAAANWTGPYTLSFGNSSVVVQEPSGACSPGPVGGAVTSQDIAASAQRYQTALAGVAAAGALPAGATVIGGTASGTATLQTGDPGTYALAVGPALAPPPWPDRAAGCDGDVDPGTWAQVTFSAGGATQPFTMDAASIFAVWGASGRLEVGARPSGPWPASGAVLALGPLQVRGEYAYTPEVPQVRALEAGGGTQVAVTWGAAGNGPDVAYRLQREVLGPGGAASGWSTVYRGGGTSWQSADQTCGRGYAFRVQAYGPDGATPWAAAPEWDAFPCSVTVAAAGPTALDVSFPAVTPQAAYELVWCVSDDCQQVAEGVGGATAVTLTGLAPNTPYTVWACSTDDAWGCPAAAAWTVPAVPAALAVAPAPGDPWNAVLTWQSGGNPPGTAYEVERATWNAGGQVAGWTPLGPPGTALAATTGGQACGLEYAYEVVAQGGGGALGAAAQSGYFQNPPCSLQAVARGSTAIAASWTPSAPPGLDQGYTLLWASAAGGGTLRTGTATAATLSGLRPATAYTLRLESSSGWEGPAVTVWTGPEPPAGVGTADVTPTGLTVNWSAAGDPEGTRFDVYLQPASGGPVGWETVTGTSAAEGGLACGAVYVPFVRALSGAGASSPWVFGPAAQTVPCPPAGLQAAVGGLGWVPSGGRGYVRLRWNPVAGAAGYDVWVWDGARYESFDVGTATSWDSRTAAIYPPDASLYPNVALGSLGPPLFSHSGGGLDLRDLPGDLYCSAGPVDCGGQPAENYWFAVSAYDASGNSATFAPGGDPCAVAAACATPTLPLQTDPAPPEITAFNLDLGGAYASGGAATFTLQAVQGVSGIAAYALSDDASAWTVTAVAGCAVGGPVPCAHALTATGPWALSPGPGSKTVWARVESAAGVWSAPQATTVYVKADQTVPTVNVVLDGGADITASAAVTVGVTVTDPVAQYAALTWRARYSTDGGQTWSAWQDEGTQRSWQQPWSLPAGAAGPRTVLVQVENSDDNLGQGGATIRYAPAPAPAPPVSATAAGQPCSWPLGGSTVAALCVTSPEVRIPLAPPPGAVAVRVSLNDILWGPWRPLGPDLTADLGAAPGLKSVWVQSEDGSGAISAAPALYYVLDPGVPAVQAAWAGGAAATDANGYATLLLSCSDAAGVAGIRAAISAAGATLYSGPCASEVPLRLAGAGYELVTVTVTNAAGTPATTEIGIYVLGGGGAGG